MGRDDKTPPTGTAVPRPRPVAAVLPDVDVIWTAPPTPINPTLRDIYALIDGRLPPEIITRISSLPAPATATATEKPTPRPSLPVRAVKASGRWTKWAMAAIGVLACVGEVFAGVEKFRGPISQAFVIIARAADSYEAAHDSPPPPPLEPPVEP